MASQDQDELVSRAQGGETEAFAELFRRHRAAVARIAYRMLGPGADLDDVVQDVFLQVHKSLPDFRGQSKFSTWLHRVAVNVVLMARRRARSRPQYAQEEHARHEPDQSPLPDQVVTRERRLAAFRRLLDKLSDKKRTVFVLHEIEGMAPAKIAEIVDCPVLTVRTRLFYARKELAQMMRSEPCLAQLVERVASGRDDDEAPSSSETSREPGRERNEGPERAATPSRREAR